MEFLKDDLDIEVPMGKHLSGVLGEEMIDIHNNSNPFGDKLEYEPIATEFQRNPRDNDSVNDWPDWWS